MRQNVAVPKQDPEVENPRATLQIGEVAARTDLSIRTIRHWEDMGLIQPSARSRGGFRLYTDEDVARIKLLRFMKPLAFTLEQMRELLQLRESIAPHSIDNDDRMRALIWPRSSQAPDRATEQQLLKDLDHYAGLAEQRLDKLRGQITQVEEFVRRLREESGRADAST